ncbi:ABC transporter ATP-binding protein [Rhizobium sp. BK068]|uniref:ABC transporter ATP-binding protein n=1 Tax=Rhizobium sp. BK068 TaxID=2512130 RepID=UPI00104686A3|nr:ABC transporter ATP-binding protein [Rhizobium sp. BK068]TCM64552.1 iron(III) transport system ATP-binding protein [Rhizobium sp. BK068]
MAKLRVEDLIVAYGAVIAVSDISFTVEDGEFVSLLGPSGCGKTTTLRCIAGLEGSSGGTIRLGDAIMAADGSDVPPDKRGINMVFQSYAVWPHMSVFENVAYGLRIRRESAADVERKVKEALKLVGLDGFAGRYGTELSGGQQQRVALARAVVTSPRLLLFDEPLSNLDAGLRDRMRFELVELQRRLGQTSLYVTHDQSEAMLMSDRIILMKDGRIVQSGTPRDLYERPMSRFAAEFIGNANIVDATVIRTSGDGSALVGLPGNVAIEGHFCRTDGSRRSGPVLACIRAESISRVSGDEAGSNCFDARVDSLGFLGPLVTCTLRLGEVTLRAELPARKPPSIGETIRVRIEPDDVIIISEH